MTKVAPGGDIDAEFLQAAPALLRGIQKLRVLWPPILPNASFLAQAGAYRQNIEKAMWSALLDRAQEDIQDAEDGFHAIEGAQKKVNDVVLRTTGLAESTALIVMNRQLHWRAIVKNAVEGLIGEGIGESEARRYLRQLGHTTLSRDRLTELTVFVKSNETTTA